MKKKWKLIFILISVAAMLISFSLVALGTAPSSEEVPQELQLHIPTQEEIRENGYPVNANGETYGPNCYKESLNIEEPDLMLSIGEDGVQGYLRTSETCGSNVTSPEEAMAYMEWRKEQGAISYPLYLQDGETVIGEFIVEYIPPVYQYAQ